MNNIHSSLVALALLVTSCENYAAVYGAPLPKTCGVGHHDTDQFSDSCAPSGLEGIEQGYYLFGHDAQFYPGSGAGNIAVFWKGYPPHAGRYSMRAYLCLTTSESEICTIRKSITSLDSVESFDLVPTKTLDDQSPHFGGTATRYTSTDTFKMCFALVDEATKQEYGTPLSPLACPDVEPLPPTPTKCTVDNHDLNVPLKVVRSNLPSSATAGQGTVKSVSINCTGGKSVTYTVSLSTASTVPTETGTAIATSTPGLGVAMFFNDKPLTSTTPLSATYGPGTSDIRLEFVAVRDPSVPASHIATGDFNADAVLVMTEQ